MIEISKKLIVFSVLILSVFSGYAKDYNLSSPNNNLILTVSIEEEISFHVNFNDELLFSANNIGMVLGGDYNIGITPKIRKRSSNSFDKTFQPVIKEKNEVIRDHYNVLTLDFKEDYSLEFRLYNEGMAYRFITRLPEEVIIEGETMNIKFNPGDSMYYQYEKNFASAYETPYLYHSVDDIPSEGIIGLPALIRIDDDIKILLAESDLEDYPGMWLKSNSDSGFSMISPGYPLEKSYEGSPYGHGRIIKHADYIAKTDGTRTFPWRVFIVAEDDGELITNQLVYKLAKPVRIEDPSWIKPGIITFDWWARRNIYGVDFKAGINTETAKYFIDFASEFNIEYFMFDDGWTNNEDIMDIHPDLDMEKVSAYAKEKDVGLMVWLIWSALDRQFEEVFNMLESWGIRGIKVDFMNRDDQEMVRFYWKVAAEAAKRKMVVDFHGAYKPAGLRRAYPNVLTREALVEFEYNGWTDYANPEHHNLLPFIRMVSGPMDYIPATMNNAQKNDYKPDGDYPMGLGTRAHAMALFVVLESPAQMLPDSPSDYYRERECMEFISEIPVEWDETKVIEAKIGDYVVLARRKGEEWYLAAITDWDRRNFNIKLDFLEDGIYNLDIIKDGPNADSRAIDYHHEIVEIRNNEIIKVNMASGGGFIGRIYPK